MRINSIKWLNNRRYRILTPYSPSEQNTIYQARDGNYRDRKVLVCIKELRSQDPARMFEVADILSTLNHPNLLKFLDFFAENGRHYFVFQYLNGTDLELLISKTRELPIPKIIEWAVEMCDVLHYLHTQPQPILYRNWSPTNLMIGAQGHAILIDLSQLARYVPEKRLQVHWVRGFEIPDLAGAPASDIYGLSSVLHYVLTRRHPVLEPPMSYLERPILEHNPDVPPPFAAIVEKALQFRPEDRYQSAAEMKAALQALSS
jgi:serine/threonine-protein kinase